MLFYPPVLDDATAIEMGPVLEDHLRAKARKAKISAATASSYFLASPDTLLDEADSTVRVEELPDVGTDMVLHHSRRSDTPLFSRLRAAIHPKTPVPDPPKPDPPKSPVPELPPTVTDQTLVDASLTDERPATPSPAHRTRPASDNTGELYVVGDEGAASEGDSKAADSESDDSDGSETDDDDDQSSVASDMDVEKENDNQTPDAAVAGASGSGGEVEAPADSAITNPKGKAKRRAADGARTSAKKRRTMSGTAVYNLKEDPFYLRTQEAIGNQRRKMEEAKKKNKLRLSDKDEEDILTQNGTLNTELTTKCDTTDDVLGVFRKFEVLKAHKKACEMAWKVANPSVAGHKATKRSTKKTSQVSFAIAFSFSYPDP